MNITRKDIAEMEQQLLEAIKISDVPFLERILHNDLLFITPGGDVITKEIDLTSHREGQMVVDEIKSTIEQINIIGDTAVVIVVYDTKGQMLGNPIEGRFRYIRFWKVFGDEIKVIGGSCCVIGNP